MRTFVKRLSKKKHDIFDELVDVLSTTLPLSPPLSEDKVVEKLLPLLRAAGWRPRDRRSSFIPDTDLKPDIWLDDQIAYVEVVELKEKGWESNWRKHQQRMVSYARHAKSQISICTDGRRWFIVSIQDGTPKYAIIDLKKYSKSDPQFSAFASLIWREGPLYAKDKLAELYQETEISKNIFKAHILKSIHRLDDAYKEYFGLVASCAYAHYNDTHFIETSKLLDCTRLLMQEHYDAAIVLMKEYLKELSQAAFPGISQIATRAHRLIGKQRDMDLIILKSLLMDEAERPLSWEAFNSDDLSEVYEALLEGQRKRHGIFATPRDLCYEVIKDQLGHYDYQGQRKIALVDPCCGSGSFLDQAVRLIGEQVSAAGRSGTHTSKLKQLLFCGQDIQDVAVAITLVNVYVACIKNLWNLRHIEIDIHVSTGDTQDKRSILYRQVNCFSPNYVFVFGNPPFVRSRSKRMGGVTNKGNLLFQITDKVMELCSPGELAFIMPSHVLGGDMASEFDRTVSQHGMRLRKLFNLPEIKLFRGVSERRHLVAYWLPDTRPPAQLLIFKPPDDYKSRDIGSCMRLSKKSKALQFVSEDTSLAHAQLYATQYIPTEIRDVLKSLPTLATYKQERILTIVQGIQEAHPCVPSLTTTKEKDRYEKIIREHSYCPGDPIFVLTPRDVAKMLSLVRKDFTKLERSHLKHHAKHAPSDARLGYPRSPNSVIFSNKTIGDLSEKDFARECPHFCAWLKPYYDLLMVDIDRKAGQLKWWQLQRSRDPRPTAKIRPGIDFGLPKILVSQFLSSQMWCWVDHAGHVAAGSSFNAISLFPDGALGDDLRGDWPELLAGWLNSYLIKEIWLKLLRQCKVRGIEGEVAIKHLCSIPVPRELLFASGNATLERHIAQLSKIVKAGIKDISSDKLIELDKVVWKILESALHKDLGRALTRKEGSIELRPVA